MKKYFLVLAVLIFSYHTAFTQATSLIIQDTRNDVTSPSSYSHTIESHFKNASIMGLVGIGSSFYTIIGLRGWTDDNTGGKAHELAFSDDSRLFFRSGNSPSWEGWRQIPVSDENGNIGIGTTDTHGFKLAVSGSAIATSMTVKLYADWPDFVFKPTYKLPSLIEVKTYIDKNHHLSGMPSAEEVFKNGLNLGETNRLLTKKVEELTLYLIEKDQQIKEIKETQQSQNAVNQKLQEQLKAMQDQLNQLLGQKGKS